MPFAEVGQYDDDRHAGIFRTVGDLDRRPGSRPAADAAQLPSSLASRRAASKASSSLAWMTSSMIFVFRTPGSDLDVTGGVRSRSRRHGLLFPGLRGTMAERSGLSHFGNPA